MFEDLHHNQNKDINMTNTTYIIAEMELLINM